MCLFIIQKKNKRKEKEKLLVFKYPITVDGKMLTV